MKLIIIFILISIGASAQSNSIDSLGKIIKTMQAQIAELQKADTLAFTPAQFTLVRVNPLKQLVSINNYTAMNTVAAKASTDVSTLTSQLNAALVRIAALEAKIKTGKIISTIQ